MIVNQVLIDYILRADYVQTNAPLRYGLQLYWYSALSCVQYYPTLLECSDDLPIKVYE
jgi:hypothetical protein